MMFVSSVRGNDLRHFHLLSKNSKYKINNASRPTCVIGVTLCHSSLYRIPPMGRLFFQRFVTSITSVSQTGDKTLCYCFYAANSPHEAVRIICLPTRDRYS